MAAKIKIVVVEWLDAHSNDNWHADLDAKPRTCYSVGYLVSENETTIVLAGMLDPETPPALYACTMTIPRACIKKMKGLK